MSTSTTSNWEALKEKMMIMKKKSGGGTSGGIDNTTTTTTTTKTTTADLWFDVDEGTLLRSKAESKILQKVNNLIPKEDQRGEVAAAAPLRNIPIIDLFPSLDCSKSDSGKYIAMDCEMVGVGPDGQRSALARVSLVNYNGHVLFDKYVAVSERVTDYRTHVSGILPHHLKNATPFLQVQDEVFNILKQSSNNHPDGKPRILVGHSLQNDFQALLLEHPRSRVRDTSKWRPFRRIAGGKSPSLKKLAKHFLGIDIQQTSHDSIDDARVAMLLYRHQRKDWENYLFRNEGKTAKARSKAITKAKKGGGSSSK